MTSPATNQPINALRTRATFWRENTSFVIVIIVTCSAAEVDEADKAEEQNAENVGNRCLKIL